MGVEARDRELLGAAEADEQDGPLPGSSFGIGGCVGRMGGYLRGHQWATGSARCVSGCCSLCSPMQYCCFTVKGSDSTPIRLEELACGHLKRQCEIVEGCL